MIRLALLLILSAPFQCASDPDPNHRMEDTPSEALWNLAERFEADGETSARNTTLRQLLDQYPASREARRAREALEASGESLSDESVSDESVSDESVSDESVSDEPGAEASSGHPGTGESAAGERAGSSERTGSEEHTGASELGSEDVDSSEHASE